MTAAQFLARCRQLWLDSTVRLSQRARRSVGRCLLSIALLPGITSAHAFTGTVISVADGDTINVLGADHQLYRVRLATIDAPERRQRYGASARARLADLVQGKAVRVETSEHDRYGRVIGVVRVSDAACQTPRCKETDVGLTLIAEGWAWHYRDYAARQSMEARRDYANAEAEARASGRGLWQDTDPLAPWQYRRERRLGMPYEPG